MCNANVAKVAAIGAALYFTGGAAAGALPELAAAGAGAAGAGTAAAGAATAGTATAGLTTLQTASLLTSAAGAGLSAYGQYRQAEAAQQAAIYNQKVAGIQARDALDRGEREGEAMGRKISAMRGQQRANMAANGLDLSYGSPAAVLDQTDYYGLEDQRTIANNARREAAAYESRGNLYGMQASSADPMLASSGSLLTGSGIVADKWYRYNQGGRAYANSQG